jgi:hypothetical protein
MNFQQMLLWMLIFGEDNEKTTGDNEKTIIVKFADHLVDNVWLPASNTPHYFFIQNSELSREMLRSFGLMTYETDKGTFSWADCRYKYESFKTAAEGAGFKIVEETLVEKITYRRNSV